MYDDEKSEINSNRRRNDNFQKKIKQASVLEECLI